MCKCIEPALSASKFWHSGCVGKISDGASANYSRRRAIETREIPIMNDATIACPNCGHRFELSDALTHQIREHLKTELQADMAKREAEAKRKLDEVKTREEALASAKDALNE